MYEIIFANQGVEHDDDLQYEKYVYLWIKMPQFLSSILKYVYFCTSVLSYAMGLMVSYLIYLHAVKAPVLFKES